MTAYAIFRQWCLDHGQVPCTEDFFHKATPHYALDEPDFRADQREIDRERREGWAYD
jgi:hypothetical protein